MDPTPRVGAVLAALLRRLPPPLLRVATGVVALAFAFDLVVFDPLPLLDEVGLGVLLYHLVGALRAARRTGTPAGGGLPSLPLPPDSRAVDVRFQGLAGAGREAGIPDHGLPDGGRLAPLDPAVWQVARRVRNARAALKRRRALPVGVEERLKRLEAAAAGESDRLRRIDGLLARGALDPVEAVRDLRRAREALSHPAGDAVLAERWEVAGAAHERCERIAALVECRDRLAARLLQLLHRAEGLHARLALVELDDPDIQTAFRAEVEAELGALERLPGEMAEARREVMETLSRQPGQAGSAVARALRS